MFEELLDKVQLYSQQFINIIELLEYDSKFVSFNRAFKNFKKELGNAGVAKKDATFVSKYINTLYNTFNPIEEDLLHINNFKGKSKNLNFSFLKNIVLYDIDFDKMLKKESNSDKKNLCLYLYNLYYSASLYFLYQNKKIENVIEFLEKLKTSKPVVSSIDITKIKLQENNLQLQLQQQQQQPVNLSNLNSLFKNKKVGDLFKNVIDNIMTSGLTESIGDFSNITDIGELQKKLMSSDIINNVKKNVEDNFKDNDLNETDLNDELKHLMDKFGLNNMNLESMMGDPSLLLSKLSSMNFPSM